MFYFAISQLTGVLSLNFGANMFTMGESSFAIISGAIFKIFLPSFTILR